VLLRWDAPLFFANAELFRDSLLEAITESPTPVPEAAAMVSEPIAPGTIQLPPDGRPIVLTADRQTVGGYPRLGAVIGADLPKAGQLWLGHEVRFVAVTLAAARAALAEQQALLAHGVTR
jgi:allophanate hydrolase subunit 2